MSPPCPLHQWTHPTEACPYCREIEREAPERPTGNRENAERARRLTRAIEAAITGDVTGFEDLFTPDVVGHGPALSVSSRDELTTGVKQHRGELADVEVACAPLDVSGPQAAVEWVASAIHSTPSASPANASPTGRRIRVRAVTIAEFEAGRIRSFRSYWDDFGVLGDARRAPAR